ncbi:MAG TPA: NAD(P)-binding protein, partial [Pseudonocardia sp.]|nr:NAD(P)-binding protein [Pseudonocardia sp.]
NALTAAAYLARAGRRVLVLERSEEVGGAAVSTTVRVPGGSETTSQARLSRYSYLVSLLPRRIVDDLGLDVRLARRRVSSYTPDPADPARGLLVADDVDATRRAFARVGAAGDHAAWTALYAGTQRLARAVFPTLTGPLPTRAELQERMGDDGLWTALVERPLGERITEALRSDLVRRGRDGRADRHARPPRRPVTGREPVLPLPRDRQRDRPLGRAGRRDGHGGRGAGAGGAGRGRPHRHRRRGDGDRPGRAGHVHGPRRGAHRTR